LGGPVTKAQLNSLDSDSFNNKSDEKGYNLNKMCHSFDDESNCKKFKDFPEAYCKTFNLNEKEIHAVTDLDVLRMLKAGGKIEQLAKLTAIYAIDIYDLGSQQSAKNPEEFENLLLSLSQ
jgi:protocatechuate 4,5-dioxygenase, alpha chain